MPEEVKKWFALTNQGKGEVLQDPVSGQHSPKASDKAPPEKEDEKDERDRAIQRALADLYGLKRSGLQRGDRWGLGAPT